MLAIAKLRCKVIGHDIRPGDLACRRCKRDACELVGHDIYTISRKQKMQVCRRCKEHGWFEGATTAILALLVLAAAALASSPRAARAQTNPPAPTSAEYPGTNLNRCIATVRNYVSSDAGITWLPMAPLAGVGGGGGTSSTFGLAFPATGTAAGFTDGINMRGAKVFDADTGVGTDYVQGLQLRRSANGGSVEIGVAGSPLYVAPDTTFACTQSGSWTGVGVTGPLTDAQLRASAVPVTANAGTNLNTSLLALDSTVAKDATLTGGSQKAIARGGAKGATTAADVTSTAQGADHQAVDVQLYSGGVAKDPTATRALTSADVVTAAQGTAAATAAAWPTKITDGTNVAAVKAASTAAAAADPSVAVALSPNSPLPAGSNAIGTVAAPALTKGTQGANGFSTQELHDAGRNQTNYFMAAPVALTNAEAMQSFSGYKGGIAVGTTVTPAVVTSNKTYRITKITVTVFASTAIGSVRLTLRANLSGSGVIGSPLVNSWQFGIPAVFTASAAMTYDLPIPEGMEFAAGTGIAMGAQGFGAPTTAAANDFVMISISGYEY